MIGGRVDRRDDLGFEFACNQRRPPSQHVLGDMNITEQVVTDIEELSTRMAQALL